MKYKESILKVWYGFKIIIKQSNNIRAPLDTFFLFMYPI